MRRRAVLSITTELFVTFLTALRADERPREFVVSDHALPSDWTLIKVLHDDASGAFELVLESAGFDIPEPALLHRSGYPYLSAPQLTVVY